MADVTAEIGTKSGSLFSVIDGMPETRGMGLVVTCAGTARRLRNAASRQGPVVLELRTKSDRAPARNASSSAPREWLGFGLNCGGAALAWVGVAGATTLVPVTGGASGVGAALLWGGALAASGQCVASTYRMTNIYAGHEATNEALDRNDVYINTMRGLDIVGLVGAGAAIKELRAANAILREAGATWSEALGPLSRPQRLRLTEALELQGARRVAAVSINAVVKQRLLDGFAAAVGIGGSTGTGVVNEVVVWVVSDRK